MKIREVGGCLRDEFLGIPTKDVDFAVEAESFEAMRDELVSTGFEIFVETEEFLTIRAKVPKGHMLLERTNVADFVLCRKDSDTGDGRRPDFVTPGTILDDLARRDFTVNAIARDVQTGEIFDPHGGIEDLQNGVLRFVGDSHSRIREDGLRVLRGFRFMVTHGLEPSAETGFAMSQDFAAGMMMSISVERIREEVEKMVAFDTLHSIEIFSGMSELMREAIFRDGLRLSATLKG